MSDIVVSGRVVAPGALATIATVPAPAAGRYTIKIDASVSGAAAADTDNMQLLYNGAVKETPIPQGISGTNVETLQFDEILDGVNPVTVQAIGAGTAAIVYEATIDLTRTG